MRIGGNVGREIGLVIGNIAREFDGGLCYFNGRTFCGNWS